MSILMYCNTKFYNASSIYLLRVAPNPAGQLAYTPQTHSVCISQWISRLLLSCYNKVSQVVGGTW